MKILLLASWIILLNACTPKGNCEHNFAFKFPMSVTPQDTFQIGDTIWYEMQLPNQLLDHTSGEYVDFTDVELFFDMGMDKWEYNKVRGGILDFKIVEDIGNVNQFVDLFTYTYLYPKDINDKHLRFGLVAQDTGLYSSGVSLPTYFLDKEYRKYNDPERFKLTDTHCWQYITKESGVRINNGNINYYLIDSLCSPSAISGDTFCASPYEFSAARGSYCFVVKQ